MLTGKRIFSYQFLLLTMIIAILITIILALSIYVIKLKTHQETIVKLNLAQQQQNTLIEESNNNLKIQQQEICQQLANTRSEVAIETERLTNLIQKNNELEQDADIRANEFYERRIKELKGTMSRNLEAIEKDYQAQKNLYLAKLEKYRSEINDMEKKQEAYIQAQKRQEEIAANQDYYRLALDELDLNDIELLRELQKRFVKKEAIDKLIWETYYKSAYDILMSHLFITKDKISGIYKITDLTTGQAYIGQSVNCRDRLKDHIRSGLSYGTATNKLYQAMKKSGPHNFTFELLEEVPKDKLNEREIYYIEFYKTKEFGMNGTRGGS